jgi:hypothetical protein
MNRERSEELAAEVKRLYEEEARLPFPYDGCRTLLEGNEDEFEGFIPNLDLYFEDEFEGFIPNLDLYFMDIAGYCSSGTAILKWPEDKVREAQSRICLTFFELYPQYGVLKNFISESAAPDLYEDLMLYEEMRSKLLELFSRLLRHNTSGI